jgi:hypothetical protein
MTSREPQLFFGLEETGADYRSDLERAFLRALHGHARARGWYGDAWHRFPDRTVVTVTVRKPVFTTLRVDFFGSHVIVGHDSGHQITDDLRRDHPATQVFEGPSGEVLARKAGEWVDAQLVLLAR